MNSHEFLTRLSKIKTDKGGRNNRRSPNKPLLILYALSRFLKGKKVITYRETVPELSSLLDEYGPPVNGIQNTWDPFVRLKNDGIWSIDPDIFISGNRVSRRELIQKEVEGGFNREVISLLENDKSLVGRAATLILENHFPDSLHNELLSKTKLDIGIRTYNKRDPIFRKKVLSAYEERCAVCGFQAKINDLIVGIEAAHIKWHQAKGPDTEENGMALCSLHHQLFDRGIITVTPDYEILVSERATGKGPFNKLVTAYHNKEIHKPVSTIYLPNPEFTGWHVNEVYKGL